MSARHSFNRPPKPSPKRWLLTISFATRDKSRPRPPLWIVECPEKAGCLSQRGTAYGAVLYGESSDKYAEMISRDTILSILAPPPPPGPRPLPARLSPGWLGYGRIPASTTAATHVVSRRLLRRWLWKLRLARK